MDGEAVLVCDATDIRYLTGVEEGISWLIVSRQGTIAISRHMLFREVSSLIPDCEVLLPCIRSTDLVELEGYVTSQLHKRFISHAWIDTTKVPASVHQRLSEACRSQGISL